MKKIPSKMKYKRSQLILGTVATLALLWALPAAAEGDNADNGVQSQRAPSRDIRRPLRDRPFLRRSQTESAPSPDAHPRHRLTDDERQSLRQDLDRARRDFYRDPDRQRGRPDALPEPPQGENK
jgi:hypothetical protein